MRDAEALVMQTKLIKVHFKTQKKVSAFVAAFAETLAFPPNLIIQWIEVKWIEPLIISDEVKALWLVETWNSNGKNDIYS